NFLHGDRFVRDELFVVVEGPEDLSQNGEDAHAVADAVRGREQQIAFQLRPQPDGPQLGLVAREARSQLRLALAPVVVFRCASDDPQRNLRCAVSFVIRSVASLANQGTQDRMLSLYARKRRANLVHGTAALQPDEAGDIDVDDSLDMGQFPSREWHIVIENHPASAAGTREFSPGPPSAASVWFFSSAVNSRCNVSIWLRLIHFSSLTK